MDRKKAPSPARRSTSSKHQPAVLPGLGAIDTAEVRKAVEEQHALNIFRRLQSDLLKLDERRKQFAAPTRAEAIDLLRVVQTALVDLTDEVHGQSDIRIASTSSTLMESLIGQLSDLDYGLVGEILRPTKGVAGPAYKFEEQRIRQMALVLVSCLREQGFSLRAACKRVSPALKRLGLQFRGEEIRDTRIYSWWKNAPK